MAPKLRESEALLKALHILTRDGKLNADSNRKLKQVHHLTQLIEPLIKSRVEGGAPFSLLDLGAGKSYLGFILYDSLLKTAENAHVISVEARKELVENSVKLAQEAGFTRMKFLGLPIDEAMNTSEIPPTVNLVVALHACDMATDDTIRLGLKRNAEAFALVPCCQAEIADQLKRSPSKPLHEFPLHRREFGSHLTNVIRTLYLMSMGYKVTVTELVGWEHSMKNELILAEKVSTPEHPKSKEAAEKLKQLLAEYQVRPTHLFD